MTIAYLVSQYPAPSHTFIRREIAALRAAGFAIATFSVRQPPQGGGPLDAAARAETEVVLNRGVLAYLAATSVLFFTRPGRWIATLVLALVHRPPGTRATLWALFHFVEALALARMLQRKQATHLHVHFANSGATVGMLAAELLQIPFSMTLHGISETDYPAGLLLGRKVARAEFVACASWFMRAQAMRHSDPADWPKLHVVRCGIDLEALPPLSTAQNHDQLAQFICVGRLSPEKGHRGLLEAFCTLRQRGNASQLEFIGDGPERDALEASVAALGLDGAVTFAGALPENRTLERIAKADVLVLPSFMEGLPIVLIEAMALGKPVIASAVAGIPELVSHRENGLLVRASDWQALADAMIELAGDPALRGRLGAAGRRTVAQEFAIENAVAPLAHLFSREVT
ncbi:MAG: glycosyltransferase family 4 protein [Novosphingobium sp.]